MKKDLNKLPPKFLEKLRKIFPPQVTNQVWAAFSVKRFVTFRLNRIKITRREAYYEFRKNNIKVREVTWCPDAFTLISPDLNCFAKTDLYQNGKIYVQNLSSMLPALILKPESKDLILDLTAAPGSKTTQLASLMDNKGKIIAIEKDEVRYQKLLANLRFQGVSNVEAYNRDGLGIWRDYFEVFDKVLLDAPCTAEGRFTTLRKKTYLYWNQLKIKRMAKKQKGLITTAFKCLKPGGKMLYSTCTFSPEENEFVVSYLLKKFPQSAHVEKINLNIKNKLTGLTKWNDVIFPKDIKNSVRIIPNEVMEGFFIAVIKKQK
ncbi:MAG: RsmB/NOP family class I SAM-dependent RNA methyltransferase [Candidatus Saelkia tenebricola]|nr:RsmB/NOP family class I SAM-dependent RNA methyltransferase [Candidatus Saelkia tenebricola]